MESFNSLTKFNLKNQKNSAQTGDNRAKKQTERSLIIFVGVLALALVIYFVIGPSWNEITATRQEIASNGAVLMQMQQKQADVEAAKAVYDSVKSDKEVISEAIGDYSDIPAAMTLIEKMAGEVLEEGLPLVINNMMIEEKDMPTDTPRTASENEGIKEEQEVTIMLSLVGNYQGLREFITKIKQLRHNFLVEKLVFTGENNENAQILNATVTLKYYYFN